MDEMAERRLTASFVTGRMSHMKSASIRDLRYRFSEIEARLRSGEELEIRRRRRVIAKLVPIRAQLDSYPDFAAIQKEIFRKRKMRMTGAELAALNRGER